MVTILVYVDGLGSIWHLLNQLCYTFAFLARICKVLSLAINSLLSIDLYLLSPLKSVPSGERIMSSKCTGLSSRVQLFCQRFMLRYIAPFHEQRLASTSRDADWRRADVRRGSCSRSRRDIAHDDLQLLPPDKLSSCSCWWWWLFASIITRSLLPYCCCRWRQILKAALTLDVDHRWRSSVRQDIRQDWA